MLPTILATAMRRPLASSAATLAIHEYQSKQLLKDTGIDVVAGHVARTAAEAESAAKALAAEGHPACAVKAQIHAGGRGKGQFITGPKLQGGVKIAHSADEARDYADKMLGEVLVTKQTGPEGRRVGAVYLEAAADVEKELYLSIVLSREHGGPVLIASTEGGVDIEAVARDTPEKIITYPINPETGVIHEDALEIAMSLGFEGAGVPAAATQIRRLYQLFAETDATQIEVNPLARLTSGMPLCLDAKLNFDDNAAYRQKEVFALRDPAEEDEREAEAAKFGLNYVALDGTIGCLVNGAGLAMATMDEIALFGGRPANFLDVGGGATMENITAALKIILSDPKVKAVCVNIFGGITKCSIVAEAVVAAAKNVGIDVPLIVRLEGTLAEEGKAILKESGLDLIPASTLAEAAEAAVKAADGQ